MKLKLSDQTHQVYQEEKDQLVFFGLEGEQVLTISGAVGEFLNNENLSETFDLSKLIEKFLASHKGEYPEKEVEALFKEIGSKLKDLNLAADS